MTDQSRYFLLSQDNAVDLFKDQSLYGPFTPADFQLIQIHFIGKVVLGITGEATKLLSGSPQAFRNFGLALGDNHMVYLKESGFCFDHELLSGIFYYWVILHPNSFHREHRILSLVKEGISVSKAVETVKED
jgi:hypothetical protein